MEKKSRGAQGSRGLETEPVESESVIREAAAPPGERTRPTVKACVVTSFQGEV